MDMEKLLTKLADSVGIGNINTASSVAKEELSKYAEVSDFGTIGVIGKIEKGANRTLLLDAHIDEVGFVVTNVFSDGFIKVSAVGGIDPRILPASRVIIHGKEDITAVFTATP
ncbi:MAG: M42 family peptidase, partial [Clostridia bacterium]|nr:M42 family peptidase [Clostridia bacterium]